MGGIKWSCDRWPRKVKSRVKDRENSWRCYWATIANYWIVCCDAVRSAILATAWLLVDNLQRQTFSHSQLHISFSVFYPISAKKWKNVVIPNVKVFSFWGLRSSDPWPGAEVWGAKAIPLNLAGAQSPYPQNIHPDSSLPRSLFPT